MQHQYYLAWANRRKFRQTFFQYDEELRKILFEGYPPNWVKEIDTKK